MSDHRSSFEIDVWFADGKPAGPIADHVASCARCAAYIEELDALAAPIELPRTKRRRTVLAPIAGVLALAAAVLLYVRSRPPPEDYVGVKGVPAVQLLVRSEGTTRVWDGRAPVHPGDAIALHVACEHLEHVTVASEAGNVVRLSDGPCPKAPSTLPFTLVVDDQPGHERFAVVFTTARADDARLRALVQARRRDRDAWVTAFDLAKEARR